ncbi:MAG: Uma2 family endonuclease [Bacteroidia bacterium]|nr:Uma2 family endonuclease [Bacteroidia bacterium]
MQRPDPAQAYTWEAYLALEARGGERYEYHDGEIVAMAGSSNRHNRIIGRTYACLLPAADRQGCELFAETVRLFRQGSERYLYPDLMLTCHPLDKQSRNGVRSPMLILEVLSAANTHKHLAFKLREYMKLPGLRHYLVVSQEECLVQHYRKNSEGVFEVYLYDRIGQAVGLPELDTELPLASVYAGIEFGPERSYAEEEMAEYGDDTP